MLVDKFLHGVLPAVARRQKEYSHCITATNGTTWLRPQAALGKSNGMFMCPPGTGSPALG